MPGIIAAEQPHIIIMDIQLAGQLNGIETAKIISGQKVYGSGKKDQAEKHQIEDDRTGSLVKKVNRSQ